MWPVWGEDLVDAVGEQNWGRVYVKVAQSHLTLCEPMGCILPGSSVYGILQVRILEWVAISSCRDRPNPGVEPKFLVSPALAAD